VTLRAVVVDDEPLARARLRRLLTDRDDVELAGEAGSAAEAVALVRSTSPDLVFLDIDMPDGTGFEVIERVGVDHMPLVVFVTAYDTFAVRAFEVHALDYLLKPFDGRRVDASLERARARLADARPVGMEPLLAMLGEMRARRASGAEPYAERVLVRHGSETRLVRLADVDWIASADNYVNLHVGPHTHLLRETMNAMAARLDPRRFTRIHRAAIVNDDRVRALRPQPGGELEAVLEDGTALPVGRSYREGVLTKWGA
jgi:two-component system LytT family response regulator